MPTETKEKTGLGNYFIANYPPFSFWRAENLADARAALESPPLPETPLGLYLHIPFCRKRCKFCYFRVYTDKNARDVETYLDALAKEIELYARLEVVGGRPLRFVYFGGGTPSFLSTRQLGALVERISRHFSWEKAEEVTFECEPGTLGQDKIKTIKDIGVTRLSLGIENFNDRVLEANGRAHLSAEIYRSYGWARQAGFAQINIDLIAGMVGETEENWRECVRRAVELEPDSVTIYQMELPFNTVFSRDILGGSEWGVADWDTKRRWVDYAFGELEAVGYEISSGYTVVKNRARSRFVYRDCVWHGADMIGTGVASFSYARGVHYQNVDGWEEYVGALGRGQLPLARALKPTTRQRMIRELVLQLKLGAVAPVYFREKFGVEILQEFATVFAGYERDGFLRVDEDRVELSREGLLRVDGLLPAFFEPQHLGSRYT